MRSDLKTIYRNREKWVADRKNSIGASESPAILGVGYANQSPFSVWAEKSGRVSPDEKEVDEVLHVGILMEPVLRSIFCLKMPGARFAPVPEGIVTYRHPHLPFLTATPDGFVQCENGPWGVFEAKNVGEYNRAEWSGEPPLRVQVQIQHQMAVTGCQFGYAMALIGGNKPHVVPVERNQRFIDGLERKLTEFWQYVERREVPPVDGSIATAECLAALHPDDSGQVVEFDTAFVASFDELERAKSVIKENESILMAAQNIIKAALGDATYGVLPDGRAVSWKTQERKECTVAASKSRVFRIHKRLPKGAVL